jgi:hypothetical protein
MAAQALDDERLVLLVDGLDEWVDEEGARRAADRLQQVIAMRDIRAVLCGRPEALVTLGSLDPGWARGQLAPLTADQAHGVLCCHGATDDAAATLVDELSRRPELTAFTRTPLLLALTWRSYGSGEALPVTRVDALGGLVHDLIHEHPARREAAGGPRARPPQLARGDVQYAIEELALIAAESGSVPLALDAARECFISTIRDRGFGGAEAAPAGRALLDIAQGSMGLLVADQPGVVFAHRALQEYLAGSAIARRPADERRQILAARAKDPAWRSTVLVALSLMEDEAEVAVVLKRLRGVSGHRAQWATASLLANAAVSVPNCRADLRADLIDDSATVVELGVEHPEQERIVDALMEGLGVPPAGVAVARRVSGWLPNRIGWVGRLWHILLEWEGEEPRVYETIWRGLRGDDGRAAREAGDALLARPPAWLGSRLEDRVGGLIGRDERTAALYTLARLDPNRCAVARSIDRAREGDHTALRAVAIDFAVRQGTQTDGDFDEALHLADGWTHVAFEWKDLVGPALRDGWPNHPRTRDLALQTVGIGGRPLDITTASWLLLSGYHSDPEVTGWILRELANDHPFVTVDDWVAYQLLAEHAKHSEAVREAIDNRITRIHTAFMPALAGAALATRSEAAKHRLLTLLRDEDSGALFWVVRALRQGWPEDADVASALEVFTTRPQAAWVASHVVEVVPSGEVDEWLLRVLADPKNRRPSSAALALATRPPAVREETVKVATTRKTLNPDTDEDLRDVLIGEFADVPEGAALAHDGLTRPDVQLQVLARAARLQPSLREPVLDRLRAIPKSLRARAAQRLYDGAGSDEAARDVLEHWAFEASSSVSAVTGAALARRSPAEEHDALVEEAIRAVHAPMIYSTGRRHGGLAVLTELGQLDRFAEQRRTFDETRPLDVDVAEPLEPDLWLAAHLAAHWTDVQRSLPDPATRLSWMDAFGFWEYIAPFASGHPACREACLAKIRESGTQNRPNLLRFLADARPRSRELLQELVSAVDDSVVDRSPRRDSLLLASDLLAEHFGSLSDEPPDEFLARLSPHHPPTPGLLLALALGWRRSATLERAVAAFNARPHPMPVDVEWRVHVAVGDAEAALDGVRNYIEYASGQTPYLPPLPAVLHRRIVNDGSFRGLIESALVGPARPAESASYSRLLAGTGQLAGAVRDIVNARCDAALDGDDVDLLAFDLVAGEVRPLGIALLEALEGEAS